MAFIVIFLSNNLSDLLHFENKARINQKKQKKNFEYLGMVYVSVAEKYYHHWQTSPFSVLEVPLDFST